MFGLKKVYIIITACSTTPRNLILWKCFCVRHLFSHRNAAPSAPLCSMIFHHPFIALTYGESFYIWSGLDNFERMHLYLMLSFYCRCWHTLAFLNKVLYDIWTNQELPSYHCIVVILKTDVDKIMQLYHHPYSLDSQKVRLALEENGIDYTSYHVNPITGKNMEPSFFRLNPSAKLPVFQNGSHIIFDTIDIIQYVSSLFILFFYVKNTKIWGVFGFNLIFEYSWWLKKFKI